MNILITGGLGHIGSYLIRNLPEDYNITIVDNLLTDRYCSLFNLKRSVNFLELDIEDISKSDLNDIDCVIHLAAITSVEQSISNVNEMESININKTKKFIDVCRESNISKFIFPSSSSVYGVEAEIVSESSVFVNPQSPYAEAKYQIEKYIEDEFSTDNIDYVILRFGTIFGFSEGMRFHTAINKFCLQTSLGIPLTIWEQNYNQSRPYLGLNDAFRCVLHFIESNNDIWNDVYNVQSINIKLRDIVSMIQKIYNKKIELNMVDTPLKNQFSYIVSDSKLKSTGFDVEDLLENKISDMKNVLKGIENAD